MVCKKNRPCLLNSGFCAFEFLYFFTCVLSIQVIQCIFLLWVTASQFALCSLVSFSSGVYWIWINKLQEMPIYSTFTGKTTFGRIQCVPDFIIMIYIDGIYRKPCILCVKRCFLSQCPERLNTCVSLAVNTCFMLTKLSVWVRITTCHVSCYPPHSLSLRVVFYEQIWQKYWTQRILYHIKVTIRAVYSCCDIHWTHESSRQSLMPPLNSLTIFRILKGTSGR